MVSWKESIKMNIIGGYIDGSASGQVRLHSKMKENHELDIVGDRLKPRNSIFPGFRIFTLLST